MNHLFSLCSYMVNPLAFRIIYTFEFTLISQLIPLLYPPLRHTLPEYSISLFCWSIINNQYFCHYFKMVIWHIRTSIENISIEWISCGVFNIAVFLGFDLNFRTFHIDRMWVFGLLKLDGHPRFDIWNRRLRVGRVALVIDIFIKPFGVNWEKIGWRSIVGQTKF